MSDQQTSGSEPTPPIDPTAIDPGTEATFSAVGNQWLAVWQTVHGYLEAAGRAAQTAGASDSEQRDAIAVASRKVGDIVSVAYSTTTKAVGGDQ